MKHILPLLLALVMTLSLAVPALAAEDVFEVPAAEEAAAPEAPAAPIEEEAPVEEAPAEVPDLPETAAAEPEDTEPAPNEAQSGTLTVLGDASKLWFLSVWEDYSHTYDYQLDYSDITIHPGDMLVLATDYLYTVTPDRDCTLYANRHILAVAPFDEYLGEPANFITIFVEAAPDGSCDLTLTVEAEEDTSKIPALIPVTVTAPEGVTVEADSQVFAGTSDGVYCEPGYVPFFTGAEPTISTDAVNGLILTMFDVYENADSVEVNVQKATGQLNLTDPEGKAVYATQFDDYLAMANAESGLVGGMVLSIVVEAGYDVESDVEPYGEKYFEYDGGSVHAYWYDIPASGDINVEVVKTDLPVDAPKSGTGWAYDKATGDYYYFVNGEQKFNYWANEPAASQWGYWYYIGVDGKLATGFQYVENENGTGWYMFQTDNDDGCIGRMLTGLQWTGSDAGMGWFNTAHGGLNGQCMYTTEWGAYNAAVGAWADGWSHWYLDEII